MMKMNSRGFLLTLILVLLPVCGWGQGKIFTKKARLSDFMTRTTKVVMSGNPILDAALSEEVKTRWRISPFEFCTLSEYESIKNDPSYYFLCLQEYTPRKETKPGLTFLVLKKGGNPNEKQSLDAAFEVISIPFADTGESTGREYTYIPAFIDIIQRFVENALVSEAAVYMGLNAVTGYPLKKAGRKIYITEQDLSEKVDSTKKAKLFGKNVILTDTHTADSVFLSGATDALVSVVMAPTGLSRSATSYQMLISADTHELYYYSTHPFKGTKKSGFRPYDLFMIKHWQ